MPTGIRSLKSVERGNTRYAVASRKVFRGVVVKVYRVSGDRQFRFSAVKGFSDDCHLLQPVIAPVSGHSQQIIVAWRVWGC